MKIEHLPRSTAARAAELLAVPAGDLTRAEFAEIADTLNRVPQRNPAKCVAALLENTVFDPTRVKKGVKHA